MKWLVSAALAATVQFACTGLAGAQQSGLGYIGEIRLFGANFCPQGWVPANRQILQISSNTALFSLYGTYYGGDGKSTFAVPNLIGRAPAGTSPGKGPLLGEEQGIARSDKVDAAAPLGFLGLNWCVAVQGMYPRRP